MPRVALIEPSDLPLDERLVLLDDVLLLLLFVEVERLLLLAGDLPRCLAGDRLLPLALLALLLLPVLLKLVALLTDDVLGLFANAYGALTLFACDALLICCDAL